MRFTKILTIGMLFSLVVVGYLAMPADASGEFEGMITINADGSVTPSNAPIKNRGPHYMLTKDVLGCVLILKDGISFNGMGHMIANDGYSFGIHLNGVSDVTVKNCHVTGFIGGIRLDYADNNQVKSNVIHDNINAGIAVMYYCDENVFKDNEIYGNTYGIAVSFYCNYNDIKANDIHDNFMYGVRLYWASNYNVVKNNDICRHYYYGVLLEYTGYNTVKDNMIDYVGSRNTMGYGIWMYYGLGYHTVKENEISNANRMGIASSGSSYLVIKENEIYDCFIGISVYMASYVEVMENHVHDCERPGIDVEDSTYVYVKENLVEDCRHGLFLSYAVANPSNNMFVENTLKDCMYGIYIDTDTTVGNTFKKNTIIGCTTNVYSEADMSDNTWIW